MSTIQKEIMFTFKELRERVKCLPLDLNRLYKEFVHDLEITLNSSGLAKARKTLMWIGAASELKPFTLQELWDALAVPNIVPSKLEDVSIDPITQNRVPIRSWDEFARVLRGTCGSFVDVVRPTNRPNDDIGPESVVQLMHQTIKDFLANSEDAGTLHFHQHEATAMVENLTIQYCKVVLPEFPTRYSPLPTSEWTVYNWKSTIEDITLYLDDKKLLSFCALLLDARKHLAVKLESNVATLNDPFILRKSKNLPSDIPNVDQISENDDDGGHDSLDFAPAWLRYLNRDFSGFPSDEIEQALGGETYDIGQGARSAVIGRLFHLALVQGLATLVKSLLDISSLIDSWPEMYQDTVLNATLFTVIDLRLTEYRSHLMGKGERLSKFVLAMDHLYRANKCAVSSTDIDSNPRFLKPTLADINQCIKLIMNHKSFQWQREYSFEFVRQTREWNWTYGSPSDSSLGEQQYKRILVILHTTRPTLGLDPNLQSHFIILIQTVCQMS
jgi:hypothetical protein